MAEKAPKPPVTMVCEYTKYEFQAPNRRSKIHPVLSPVTQEAFNAKVSSSEIFRVARAAAEQQLPIEEIAELCRDRIGEVVAEREGRAAEYRKQLAERKEAARQRDLQNALLKKHGYRWSKSGFSSEEDADFTNFNSVEIGVSWTLLDPSGNPTTVAEALAAIQK